MEATHFLMKTLPRVATEMALHVLAYNLTLVMNMMDPGHPKRQPCAPGPFRDDKTARLQSQASATAFSHDQDPERTSVGRRGDGPDQLQ